MFIRLALTVCIFIILLSLAYLCNCYYFDITILVHKKYIGICSVNVSSWVHYTPSTIMLEYAPYLKYAKKQDKICNRNEILWHYFLCKYRTTVPTSPNHPGQESVWD